MRKVYSSLYYQKDRDLGQRPLETQVHRIRDGLAMLELVAGLQRLGYAYGGALLNIPFDRCKGTSIEESHPCFGDADLILQVTRPPLDDDSSGLKRQVKPSRSPVESLLLQGTKLFLQRMDRESVVLADNVVPDIPGPAAEEYREVKFFQSNGGLVDRLGVQSGGRSPAEAQLTIGYVCSLPPGSVSKSARCRMVACWGMGGNESLFLSLLLTRSEPYQQVLRSALEVPDPVLLTIPFLVPTKITTPLLGLPADEVQPRRENGRVIAWRLPTSNAGVNS